MSLMVVMAATPARGAIIGPTNPCSAQNATPGPGNPGGLYPNDPGYSPAENGVAGATWNDEQWYLYGCMPQGAPLSTNPENASGMNVDKAWAQYSKGSDQVVVAYMEGGVNWRISSSCELKDQAWLNTKELPLPEDTNGHTKPQLIATGQVFTHPDPYDLNDNGVVNVEDYLNDPRVKLADIGVPKSSQVADPSATPFLHHVCDQSLTGILPAKGGTDITPEDLIVAFGHCQVSQSTQLIVGAFPCDQSKHYDNDGNGYANDINGWNFNRDTNDPQTEQSIYGHFNGESGQMVAQADNNYGNAGVCPLCRYIPIKAGDEAIDRPDRVAEAITFAADSGVKVMDATSASLGLTDSVKAAIDYAYHKGMVVVFASNDFESADHTDGMFYPHVWPGNSVTGDHSTRGATPPGPLGTAFYGTNSTFLSRSSLTSYGPHSLFSPPSNDGSTSTGTPTNAGVAALVAAEGANAAAANGGQLNADEIKQVVRATSLYIGPLSPTDCPSQTCFQGIAGASFNIMYGYGRPNVFKADQAVAAGHIPPTADIRSPDWYQPVDPTKQSSLHVSADLAAPRSPAGAFTYTFQYGLGPQPTEAQFHNFGGGASVGAANVGADLDLSQIPSSFWSGAYAETADRLSIEQYDVTIRVQVHALDRTSTVQMGEDRRAIHVRHDATEHPGFPVKVGSSGEASPTMADIEGRGWLDTIVSTADGTVHAYRPDGTEAPGFPVRTGFAPGVDPTSDVNYLGSAGWRSGSIPPPHDGGLSTPAVGDLRHDGGLEIVMSTFSGRTYAWDGAGNLLPGFPVLNGNPSLFHLSVPPPNTPYSFEPENITGGSPVLADLGGDGRLDIIQVAGDNHIYAYQVSATGVSLVPGWPVCDIFNIDSGGANPAPAGGPSCTEPAPPAGYTHTHDGKIVPTPAIASIDGTGKPNLIVGLDDTTWGPPLGSMKITSYLEAFSSRGTLATPTGQLAGWPVQVTGLEQGYGVAQDFVTQGTESPVIYDGPNGPQAIVNSNLFDPVRVDLTSRSVSQPFAALSPEAVTLTTLGLPPLAIVPFTTSASLGKVAGGTIPLVAQPGSSAGNVVLGITQTPGLGIKVENAMGVWQPDTGATTTVANHRIQGLAFFTAPAIADVSGTGLPAIIQPTDSGAVEGFDLATGTAVAGFPKWTGGWSLFTPAVGDLTGSGTVAVAAATREGYLHVWDTPGLTSANHEAWHWHQDDRNTGHYGTDTRPPAGIRDLAITTGTGKWTLTFTAPGDDWNSGTAAAYDVRCSPNPITQQNFGQATPVDLGGAVPGANGTKESIAFTPPAGAVYCAVRAVDKAGNIGPIPLAAATTNGGIPAGATPSGGNGLPRTSREPAGAGGLVLAMILLLTAWRGRPLLRRALIARRAW
ncbi:MAG TPA: S8 family serine peptidase [Candidatus Dormibacteraeota bacterium]